MAKIAFLGAGSFGFGRRLIGDLLSFPELLDSTIHLVDPDSERLELTHTYAQRIVRELNLPTQIAASTERKPALDGADYVIVSIRVGANMGPEALDVQIPLEVGGLRQTVSDTVGIGGLMKGLRTIPAMLDIARDMERLCPDAPMLNYTNPMAMIMWAVLEATSISGVGLCHSVQGTSKQLANYMGVDYDNLRYRVAGINHMAWFLELSQDGETLYPQLNACLEDPEIVARDPVRFEILKHFGRFVTESSRHMAEYVPYFMQHPDEMARMKVEHRTAESFVNQHADREERIAQAKREAEIGTDRIAAAPTNMQRSLFTQWRPIPPPTFTGTCSILISSPISPLVVASKCQHSLIAPGCSRAMSVRCHLSVRHSVRPISICKG